MRDKGATSGFLISKLGILVVVVLLISSMLATQEGIEKTTQKSKINSINKFIISNLREADSLPGKFKLERKLPSLSVPYEVKIFGEYENYQIIKIQTRIQDNLSETIFLKKETNGGKFQLQDEDPEKIIITGSDKIFLRVI